MSFYFPLTLGVRRQRPAPSEQDRRDAGRHVPSEGWREGVTLAPLECEEHPAARVLDDLRRAASTALPRRLWFVLGEPGAGKSTLLERWFDHCADELAQPYLGLTLPVLVRLRELRPGDLDGDPEAAADRLWREHGAILGAARLVGRGAESSIYRVGHCRAFRPLWLLDGLDELEEQLQGERLFEWLVVLPGAKLITCRTAVFETLRDKAEPHKERELEILPLKLAEQESFLVGAVEARGGDPAEGKALHKAVQSSAALRALAGKPLILALIALFGGTLRLDNSTRAAFYREVVEAMWLRKVPRPEALQLLEGRERTLAKLAWEMGYERLEDTLTAFVQASNKALPEQGDNLRLYLERSGLLSTDARRGVFSFLHPTFQEFYLARALKPSGLREPLERHWTNPRYDETLALLISIMLEAGRASEVDGAVRWLLDWGAQTHKRNPNSVWQLRRSPIRVAIHLLGRAGATLKTLPQTRDWLENWLRSSPLRRHAVAADSNVPADLLGALARDVDNRVRRCVAANGGTPAEGLAVLARDDDKEVRCKVALNPAASADILADLACSEDKSVRRNVATNPAAPARVLASLARDRDLDVRCGVALNPATPDDELTDLACGDSKRVRRGVAINPAAPAKVLAALARDDDADVRADVARNNGAPVKILIGLSRDTKHWVRSCAARNTSTPAEALTALARDLERHVRAGVAANSAAPPEVLALLASSRGARDGLAENSATPPDMLVALAGEESTYVRGNVGNNSATPPQVLATLAADQEAYVRTGVAANPAAPAELLARLARDPHDWVRSNTAMNPATPANALAGLARDHEESVRKGVARNPAAPPAVLARLVRDQLLAELVAPNPNAFLEDLGPPSVCLWLQTTWDHVSIMCRRFARKLLRAFKGKLEDA